MVEGNTTSFYNYSFGGPLGNCSDRVYSGKIVLNNSSTTIASGWITAQNGNSTIIINRGEPFSLTGTPANSCTDLSNSDDLVPIMTSDTEPSGIAIASSSWSPSAPYKAFDNCSTTIWHNSRGTNFPHWIGYDFQVPTVINKLTMTPGNDQTYRYQQAPKDFTIEGWNGSDWVVLNSWKGVTDWKNGIKKEFTFSNTLSYTKYRVHISANNGYTSTPDVSIAEVEFGKQ